MDHPSQPNPDSSRPRTKEELLELARDIIDAMFRKEYTGSLPKRPSMNQPQAVISTTEDGFRIRLDDDRHSDFWMELGFDQLARTVTDIRGRFPRGVFFSSQSITASVTDDPAGHLIQVADSTHPEFRLDILVDTTREALSAVVRACVYPKRNDPLTVFSDPAQIKAPLN